MVLLRRDAERQRSTMQFSFSCDPLDSTEVEQTMKRAGVDRFYLDRIMYAVRWVCTSNTARSGYAKCSVSPQFPRRGSFTFYRVEDSRKFRLRLKGNQWLCD